MNHTSFVVIIDFNPRVMLHTGTCGKHTEVIACVVVRRCCSLVSYGGQYSALSSLFVMEMLIKDFAASDFQA